MACSERCTINYVDTQVERCYFRSSYIWWLFVRWLLRFIGRFWTYIFRNNFDPARTHYKKLIKQLQHC